MINETLQLNLFFSIENVLNLENFNKFNTFNSALINEFNILNSFMNTTQILSLNYLNLYYDFIINLNNGYINYIWTNSIIIKQYYYLLNFFITFIKLNIIIFIVYSIFFLTYFENYFKKIIYSNSLAKLIILNETEKEAGPVDDFLYFALLFILTISFFIFITVSIILFHSKFYIWINASFALLAFFFLTLPVNLFFDYGVSFVTYIRGSASSSSLLKELIFDIINTFTVFIRFIIQNIRFLFILLAIFELLEWVLNATNNNFLTNYVNNSNIFVNSSINLYNFNNENYNIIIINSILFIIAYFYYFLHLLFLLLVQITIYIGISAWLFFFLYSTKFLSKYEKFFVTKKI